MSSTTINFEELFAAQVRKINEKHMRSQLGLPENTVRVCPVSNLRPMAQQAVQQRVQQQQMIQTYRMAPMVVVVEEEPFYDGPNIFLYQRRHYPEVEHPEVALEAVREQYDQMRRSGTWSQEVVNQIDARIRMAHLGFLDEIDLHGMSVEGAVGLVTEALDAVKEVLKKTGERTFKMAIITGYGSNSRNRHSEIQARVIDLLETRCVYYRIDKRRKGLVEATYHELF